MERKLITADLLDRNFAKYLKDEDTDEPYWYWEYKAGDHDDVTLYGGYDDGSQDWLLTIDGTSTFKKGYLELYIKYVDELQQALDLFGVGIKVGEMFIY